MIVDVWDTPLWANKAKKQHKRPPRRLTVKAFRKWLEAQPADHIYKWGDPNCCPIAQFTNDGLNVETQRIVRYARNGEEITGILEEWPLQQWSKDFIHLYDGERGTLPPLTVLERVTAKKARD
jgi:hypothetical protein